MFYEHRNRLRKEKARGTENATRVCDSIDSVIGMLAEVNYPPVLVVYLYLIILLNAAEISISG